MERKLLSLPSFFVLLLVAGIAFLATPVVDLQAAPPIATVTVTAPSGTAEVTSGNVEFTITFDIDVKVTSATAPIVAPGVGFGPEDLDVRYSQDAPPEGDGGADVLSASEYTFAVVPASTTPAIDANTRWTVTVPVPTGHRGDIVVSLLRTAAIEDADNAGSGHEYVFDATDTASRGYNTYNPLPAVRITSPPPSAGVDPFEVTFTIYDDKAFATAPTFASTGIDILGGSVRSVGPVTAVTSPTAGPGTLSGLMTRYTVNAFIVPSAGATKVLLGVKAGAVTDAGGATNAAVAIGTLASPASTATTVTIDSVVPTVKITPVETLADSSQPKGKDNVVTSITVTFDIQEDPDGPPPTGALPAATILESALPNKLEYGTTAAAQDITVTGGTLSDFAVKPAQYNASYTATITPAATAENVVITVKAGAVTDAAGNNSAQATATVVTGYAAAPPVQPKVTEFGAATAEGFSVQLHVPGNSFVVLARSAAVADNGISGLKRRPDNTVGADSTEKIIDIKDDVWQDLSTFMGVGPGGAIDLIGPAGSVNKDLVISEIMWGSDLGLGSGNTIAARANSQWIELYNTKATPIIGTWELRFTKSGTGIGATYSGLSDKFTNFGLTQSNQFWSIPDTDGGAYGQGGRTSSSGTNIGTLQRLVSMERKIDFVKVETSSNDRPKQLEGVPAGDLAGSWQASKDPQGRYLTGRRLGTPGASPFVTVSTTGISGSVVFNEIANRSNKKFDWIELYNPGSSDVKINGWVLSKVTAVDKDEELFKFASEENIVVPAKGFLLVVNEDPSETALAAGKNIDNPRSKANGLPTEFYINEKLDIPKEKFLLILRTELKLGSHEKIVDIGGHLGDLDLNNGAIATEVWPLRAWTRIKGDDLGENDSNTWRRDRGKNLHHGDAWKSDGGFTGLGIDRNPESDEGPTSGTPGFDNGAIKDKVKDLKASDPVVISEIMFGRGGTSNRPNPQWIELFNPSKTQAVKLLNWRLEVQNITIDPEENLNVDSNYTLILPDKLIQPNQTLLIVSASAREATRDRFPADRIINVWSTRKLRETVEMTSARDAIMSSVAFYLKLSDPDKVLVDHVGNISRPRDEPRWELPGGNLDEGGRASMIRRKGTFGDGTEADSWISAATVESGEKVSINEVYYGDSSDLGTPGYRQGGPVPVQLSSFYSKRNDAGAVIITWATESELDNAGFNILRSSSRSGEFTRINSQLIPGAGTTGEKNTYTWTDTSAKPNVVYYYQIQDVSLDGAHRTLRTTRLRGHVGAHGKLTTTWSSLKSRD